MAGNSSRGKSPGSGYQGSGAKTDYSSNARDSYNTTIAGNKRQNNITSNSTTVSKSPGAGYQGAGAKTDYSSRARDSYDTAVGRQTTAYKSPANPIGRRYAEPIGPKMPGKTRGVGSFFTSAVAKPPTKKPATVAKAPVKKPVQVVSNVVREKPTPVKAAPPARPKPTAARFGVMTGTTTGTRASGGGGYGGGGTRGGGSLSGGGSGSRSAGTSRTGGTRTNEPAGPKRY